MTDKMTENKLAKYFAFQEDCFVLPEEDKIKAFHTENIKADVLTRKTKKIRLMPTIAACMAIIISIASVILIFKRDDSFIPTELEFFGEATQVEGIANWYEPGEITVEATILQHSRNSLMNKSGFIQTLSYEKIEREAPLPDWVIDVTMANERYAILEYETRPQEYNHGYILYDLQENKIFSLGERIFELTRGLLESLNDNSTIHCGLIEIEYFGESPEWCIFRTRNNVISPNVYERYLINIETGELHKLPTSKIITKSSDYTKFVFDRTEATENSEISRKIITYYDIKTKTEKAIIRTEKPYAQYYSQFSKDNRYIIIYTNYGADWNNENTKWLIYDTQTRNTNPCVGKIIRYTEKNDAVIVKDRMGTKIYRLSDMADVTDSYSLKVYEYYEIKSMKNENGFLLYLTPIFDKGEEILIADNIVCSQRWGDYIYIYQAERDEILVYSIRNNEYFTCELDFDGRIEPQYQFSMFINNSGRNCHIVAYHNKNSEQGEGL